MIIFLFFFQMGIVFSDLYVGLKLLARVQKERRLDAMKHIASIAATYMSEEVDNDEGAEHIMNRESSLKSTLNKCSLRVMYSKRNMRSSVLTIQSKPLSEEYEVIERAILSNDNDNDRRALADGAHFVPHSVNIYHKIGHAVHDHPLCVHNATFAIPVDSMNDDSFYLKSIPGQEYTKLVFASFFVGIHATVYAILADEVAKAIVISVRGTISLEDVVVDLQVSVVTIKLWIYSDRQLAHAPFGQPPVSSSRIERSWTEMWLPRQRTLLPLGYSK